MDRDRVVVALGGNTLLGESGPWTIAEQRRVIADTATAIAEIVEAGHEVVLTHGNGPQAGNFLLQQERAPETPQHPLDVIVAETQAQIGYLLQQALDNELSGERDFVTVVTQSVVDPDDPAFDDPTKPVGPYYTPAEAAEKAFETRAVGAGEESHRRVVASPDPIEIVEVEEIGRLVDRGNHVVCAGGGGVPVVRDDGLRGVEAVIDKDLASQLLAVEIHADALVILTDVDHAYVNFGDPNQRPLETVTTNELRGHLTAGEFGEGSMRPKVEACLRFVEAGSGHAVITSPANLAGAIEGEVGTVVRAGDR